MKAKTFQSQSIADIIDNIDKNDFKPSLALVFSSFTQDLKKISHLFKERGIQLVGVTTSGEIESVSSFEDSVVVMLLELPESSFQVILEELVDNDVNIAAKNLAVQAEKAFANPSILIFSGGVGTDGQQIVDGIKSNMKSEIPLFGGLAGDNLQMKNTYVFTNEIQSDHALLAVVFDQDKVDVKSVTTSGWVGVGTEKTITHSEGNVVFTIDNQPALEVFAKYLGLTDIVDVAAQIGARYPLQLIREDGSTVLRAPLFANAENKSLIFAGGVPQGSLVKFSVVPDFDVIEKTIHHVEEMKTSIPEADALLMVSCAARKLSFGPMVDDEIEGIQKIWNAPMAGFFAYGEIGHKENAKADFHNETISLIAIKEK